MAKSNRDRVGEVIDALKAGLGSFVVREYALTYGNRVIDELNTALTSGVYGGLISTSAEAAAREIDTQGCLNAMQRRWEQVFKAKLGKSERGYVNILSDVRNEWAHQSPFTNDQAYEAADIARRGEDDFPLTDDINQCRYCAYRSLNGRGAAGDYHADAFADERADFESDFRRDATPEIGG